MIGRRVIRKVVGRRVRKVIGRIKRVIGRSEGVIGRVVRRRKVIGRGVIRRVRKGSEIGRRVIRGVRKVVIGSDRE